MAVDVYYSDNFVGMISPRLSFSRDLDENESTSNPINDYSCRIDSALDFAFNVDTSVAFASSSADELFSDGKIIPACLKGDEVNEYQQISSVMPCLDLHPTTATEERKKSLKEFLEDSIEEEEEEKPNNASASASASATAAAKSFWQFRRSNSLNCDRNQRKGLIGSWKILSRSGSTGKFLEKIVEEEKPNTNFQTKLLRKFSRNNSMNNSENVTTCNVSNKGSSSKILRRSHSTSDKYFAKSDWKQFRRSNSTGSSPNTNGNRLKKQQSEKQRQDPHQLPCQKGKAKDSFRGYYSSHYYNNLKINPVLNLPSPYISRVSVDLFSFGSLFCNGTKDRKKRNKNDI